MPSMFRLCLCACLCLEIAFSNLRGCQKKCVGVRLQLFLNVSCLCCSGRTSEKQANQLADVFRLCPPVRYASPVTEQSLCKKKTRASRRGGGSINMYPLSWGWHKLKMSQLASLPPVLVVFQKKLLLWHAITGLTFAHCCPWHQLKRS